MIEKTANTLVYTYLQHCQIDKGLSQKTIKAYRIDLLQFSRYIDCDLHVCDKAAIQNYLLLLRNQYKVKSVKRKISSLKAFYAYLVDEEIILSNPFEKLRIKLHEPFLLPKAISLSTIDTILQNAYTRKKSFYDKSSYPYKSCLRDIAVLELLFATGMRVSELCALGPDDIDFKNEVVKIYGKGSKERIIHIGNPDVLLALSTYYTAFSRNIKEIGWFFVNRQGNPLSDQSVRNMINMYVKLAGLEQHITPHMFRHSFATLLLEEDVDIRYIQQLLGHSSITTTQIYTHITSKKQREILANKHPRNRITL